MSDTDSSPVLDTTTESDSEEERTSSKKEKKKKKKKKDKKTKTPDVDAADGNGKKKKKKKEKKKKESDAAEDLKSKPEIGSNDEDDPEQAPKSGKKKKQKENEDPNAPRNPDGTIWKNPLQFWTARASKVKEEGTMITMKVPQKTDFWRKTRYAFIKDNGPYYWHKVKGDFEVIVKISGGFSHMYDKAGIMIRADAENWITTGMECFNDQMNHATCVTLDYSDWSLAPLPKDSEKEGVWFCLKKIGNAYESFYSTEGKTWCLTRQGLFHSKEDMQVGICAACPMGEEFKVSFDFFRVKPIGG